MMDVRLAAAFFPLSILDRVRKGGTLNWKQRRNRDRPEADQRQTRGRPEADQMQTRGRPETNERQTRYRKEAEQRQTGMERKREREMERESAPLVATSCRAVLLPGLVCMHRLSRICLTKYFGTLPCSSQVV